MALVAAHAGEQAGMEGRVAVAGGTGGRQAVEDAAGMTVGAGQPGMGTLEREGCQIVVEVGWQPGSSAVASGAARSVRASMGIIPGMARHACGRCAGKDPVDVAGFACHADVGAGEFKGSQVVVKEGRAPAIHVVAGTAIRAKAPTMGVICGVAGKTVGWSPFEDPFNMTGGTWDANVFPLQGEY